LCSPNLLTWVELLSDQTNSLLSFPPLARDYPSNDHFKPQTSCLWPVYRWIVLAAMLLFTRISVTWIDLSREPLAKVKSSLQAKLPIRSLCRVNCWIGFNVVASKTYTIPLQSPIPRRFPDGLHCTAWTLLGSSGFYWFIFCYDSVISQTF